MNKSNLKSYAPAQTQGDVTVIAGHAWPAKISNQSSSPLNTFLMANQRPL